MYVDIIVNENAETIQITKYEIEYACHYVTGNKYLISFAYVHKHLRIRIKNKLNGDLAIRINNLVISKEQSPLTVKEKDWANSFCQNLLELSEKDTERLSSLLAEDFQKRFSSNKKMLALIKTTKLSTPMKNE